MTAMKPLEIDRTAIIAIHLQHDMIGPDSAGAAVFGPELERTGVLRTVARILERARKAGVQVVYTRIAFQPGFPDLVDNSPLMRNVVQFGLHVEGTPGAEITDEFEPQTDDLVVTNQRLTGFAGSELDTWLRAAGIDTLVFTGVATNLSVEGTARAAVDLGYRTVIVADACATNSQAAHDASLATMALLADITTADELLEAMP
ncbi:cysteine hydrolase family protein [Streptomyces sp. NPDC090499]|uniref:cysteine hydrolase family protein n=1 Tax=Streptomyces sp. NPDC090499 TaxID=3365965 RepID=UPI0037F88AB1